MNRLYILCEGNTEEQFVKKVMHGWFAEREIEHQQIILKHPRRVEKNRGSVISYAQVKRDILRLCNKHRSEYVTTLIDYSPVLNTAWIMTFQVRIPIPPIGWKAPWRPTLNVPT